jgi:hypothetical protein
MIELTGTTVISDGRALDYADELLALREVRRVEDSLRDNESNTMERLKDAHVNLAAASYEHYASSQRRMVNQIISGPVSRHKLLNVL